MGRGQERPAPQRTARDGTRAPIVALVTGATGFIGSHLTRRLVDRGMEVHVLCRTTSNFARLADVRSQLVRHVIGLGDRPGLRRIALAVRPELVFHLAAATMHGGVSTTPAAVIATNLLGTVNLIDACDAVPYRCFVHTGDALEYGPKPRPMRESSPCRPITLDGISKLGATLYAQRTARQGRKPLAVLRPFSVFGPDDDGRRLISRLVAAALGGREVALSDAHIARDFLYVEDLVDLYLAVTHRPARAQAGIFNAASGRQTTLGELVRTMEALGAPCRARWAAYPRALHDTRRWQADITKTLATFAWRPRTSLAAGLRKTIAAATRGGDH